MIISANLADLHNKKIYPASVTIQNGLISKIDSSDNSYDTYILPGFIDSHIHIESSMLIPSEFARIAVTHGTIATVSDPHEIANVCGMEGIRYMIDNGKKVPFKFYFGASSCVPATVFETAGADISPKQIRELFEKDGLKYLSEMMNYQGVLNKDPEVMDKIRIAHEMNKPVDGHSPSLKGELAEQYISAGITTDHECFTLEEALDKLKYGMKIIIREGSAAKNYDALHTLIRDYPDKVMFCSDDKHPDALVEGHINQLVKRSLDLGYDLFDVLRIACVNPVNHYGLDVGLLKEGDPGDFIVVDNLTDFNVLQTYINGELVSEKGKSLLNKVNEKIINNFKTNMITEDDLIIKAPSEKEKIRVIEALDKQLITNGITTDAKIKEGEIISDIENDVLKLIVVNRYTEDVRTSAAFIKNFGFKKGAIASSVAHDSHNIVAVGAEDAEIVKAVNAVIQSKGGISVSSDEGIEVLPLPVGGLMTNSDGYETAEKYTRIDRMAKKLGTQLTSPFMTLSFMALLVIPSLKLSDKGLFDGSKFEFANLII